MSVFITKCKSKSLAKQPLLHNNSIFQYLNQLAKYISNLYIFFTSPQLQLVLSPTNKPYFKTVVLFNAFLISSHLLTYSALALPPSLIIWQHSSKPRITTSDKPSFCTQLTILTLSASSSPLVDRVEQTPKGKGVSRRGITTPITTPITTEKH